MPSVTYAKCHIEAPYAECLRATEILKRVYKMLEMLKLLIKILC